MFMYFLATNPEKQEIVYQEIITVLGKDETTLTESMLNRLKYLKASLKESLRLFGSVMGLGRKTQVDMVLSEHFIPKGTYVTYSFYNNHMDDKQFPNPEQFLPERWLRDCPIHQKPHPFAYMPFAHGPRMCIGRRFAELELLILAIKMLQRFRLEYHDEPIDYETGFTARPTKNVNLRLIDRNI